MSGTAGNPDGAVLFPPVEEWSSAVDGSDLLDEIVSWLNAYLYLPVGAAPTIAVWSVASWFIDEVYFAPILTVLSPTKRSGKSNLLEAAWGGLSTHQIRTQTASPIVGLMKAANATTAPAANATTRSQRAGNGSRISQNATGSSSAI